LNQALILNRIVTPRIALNGEPEPASQRRPLSRPRAASRTEAGGTQHQSRHHLQHNGSRQHHHVEVVTLQRFTGRLFGV